MADTCASNYKGEGEDEGDGGRGMSITQTDPQKYVSLTSSHTGHVIGMRVRVSEGGQG